MKPLTLTMKVFGCVIGSWFFMALALGNAFFEDWLLTGIFTVFSFCGITATFYFAAKVETPLERYNKKMEEKSKEVV